MRKRGEGRSRILTVKMMKTKMVCPGKSRLSRTLQTKKISKQTNKTIKQGNKQINKHKYGVPGEEQAQ